MAELRVLRSNTEAIIKHLAANSLNDMASKLLSNGLLPQEVYDGLSLENTPKVKAAIITNAVKRKVDAEFTDFQNFLDCLRSNEEFTKLADLLKNKFDEGEYVSPAPLLPLLPPSHPPPPHVVDKLSGPH